VIGVERIAVLGAGSWGTALAFVLAENGHDVRIWGHRQQVIDQINETHKNEKYLPGVELPHQIKGFTSLEKAIEGVETLILAVPTKAIREVLQQLKSLTDELFTIVHVSKGIEPDSLLRISQMIQQEIDTKDIVVRQLQQIYKQQKKCRIYLIISSTSVFIQILM
jgi:glycerol-3-phosphate dehydrogenase (NAD(P)+)